MLDQLGLAGAIEVRAEELGLDPVIDSSASNTLPAAVELAAYLISSEAILNAKRHGHATAVRVNVVVTAGALHLDVTDNGVGIAPQANVGIGLHSMHRRAAELGGRCRGYRSQRHRHNGVGRHATPLGHQPMIRVVIIDDHLVYRRGVATLLADTAGIEVVGEAADAAGALSTIAATRPDVVLLDLGLPDRSGLALLPELRTRWPALAVVVVTMDDEDAWYAQHCIEVRAATSSRTPPQRSCIGLSPPPPTAN